MRTWKGKFNSKFTHNKNLPHDFNFNQNRPGRADVGFKENLDGTVNILAAFFAPNLRHVVI